jgi:hypothetical protein
MIVYQNKTNEVHQIEIPVEFDGEGNPTRIKTHFIEPNEILSFNSVAENSDTIVQECINNFLTSK